MNAPKHFYVSIRTVTAKGFQPVSASSIFYYYYYFTKVYGQHRPFNPQINLSKS